MYKMDSKFDGKFLFELFELIKSRRLADKNRSYVAKLYSEGEDRILQKVGEEAIETIISFKSNDRKWKIYESADLVFHLMVALSNAGIEFDEVITELKSRSSKDSK